MKKRGISRIMLLSYIFIFILSAVLLELAVIAATPEPHNIKGYVFQNNSAGGIGGIPVLINDPNSSNSKLTYTLSQPPAFPFLGSYSAVINGSDGDILILTAWNKTHYGIINTTLASGTNYLNITLNITRPSETNVTIINPANNAVYNITAGFNITANITIIGGQNGVNCNATIEFSDSSILKLSSGETPIRNIGSIPLGSTASLNWSVIANKTGSSNASVSAACLDSGNFDNRARASAYNLTVQDTTAPVIRLLAPVNMSIITASGSALIDFEYNVTDDSDIANCSLIINQNINRTNSTIQKGISQLFNQQLSSGNYTWQVNCTENSTGHNTGSSGAFNLSIIPNMPPIISNVAVTKPIDLTPGSTKIVVCNGSVTDENNASDIIKVNATFYDASAGPNSADDKNSHYTNDSCANISSSYNQKNYTCSFQVEYFANSGSWECNITGTDSMNLSGSSIKATNVTELIAINISPSTLDYGNLESTQTSQDVNLTITNLGNIAFNVSVDGFGIVDGDNLAVSCSRGNVGIDNERYSIAYNTNFGLMTNLSDTATKIANFTLQQRTADSGYVSDRNTTYWKLHLPSALQGSCNGSIRLTAVIT